jgi:hypothetical protein
MRRIASVAALTLVLGLGAANPSEAIFGLSKCEKIKKQIKGELKVGDLLFKNYRQKVSEINPKKPNETFGQHYEKYANALNALSLVFDSDIKTWTLAKNNPSCFSSEKNAAIRVGLNQFENSSNTIKDWIKKKDIFSEYKLNTIYTKRMPVNDIFFE